MNRVSFAKLLGLVSALALGVVLLAGAEEAPQSSGPTAAEQFKNIKVLKDLPANQLLATMQEYSTALGGNCAMCHVDGDFASDDKKMKLVARDMILLTQKLNETEPTVKKGVTCFMCHHGRSEPFSTAAQAKAAEDKAKADAEKKAADDGAKQ
jgi:photosynthetic reaction center cytochrome c subunit